MGVKFLCRFFFTEVSIHILTYIYTYINIYSNICTNILKEEENWRIIARLTKHQRSDVQLSERLASLSKHYSPTEDSPWIPSNHHSTIVLRGLVGGPQLELHDVILTFFEFFFEFLPEQKCWDSGKKKSE